jgi:two-component system OmpR family response regulator
MSTAKSIDISIGSVRLDSASHQAWLEESAIELGRREYMLLKALMENAGRVQTRDALEKKLYSWGEEIASNAIEVHIHNLRKKLPPEFIKTVRGVGYIVSKS